MHWDDRCPSSLVPKKVMAALHSLNKKASPLECYDQKLSCGR